MHGKRRVAGLLATAAWMTLAGNATAGAAGGDGIGAALGDPQACAQAEDYHACTLREEARRVGESKAPVKRDGPQLCVRPSAGAPVCYRDITLEQSEETYAIHRFRGVLPNLPLAVIDITRHEAGAIELVSLRTGARTELSGIAALALSPDGRHLAAASADLEAGYFPNDLAIYRIDGDALSEAFRVAPDDWGPASPRWQDANTLRITESTDEGAVHVYRRHATGWREQ
ncbi:hypothetical protein [Montanilutibacter psychrotolerans]|nr:hypothetical protein [Lysobacter psychrotolerans]